MILLRTIVVLIDSFLHQPSHLPYLGALHNRVFKGTTENAKKRANEAIAIHSRLAQLVNPLNLTVLSFFPSPILDD